MCLQLHVLYWRGNQRRTVERTCTCDTEWLLCVIACYRYKPVAWGNRWLRWSRDLWIQYRMFAVGRVSFWLRLRVWKWLQKFSTGCSQLEESLSGWDYVFENCCKNSVQNVRSWRSPFLDATTCLKMVAKIQYRMFAVGGVPFWMRLHVWKWLQKFSTECSQLEESLPWCDYVLENGCKNMTSTFSCDSYQLTLFSWALEDITVALPVRKFPAFCITQDGCTNIRNMLSSK